MKKVFSIVLALLVAGSMSSFAKENSSSGFHLITAEITGGAIAVGITESGTYNYMFNDTFGLGGGIAVSEGFNNDIVFYGDVKYLNWDFALGAGYEFGYVAPILYLKAAYQSYMWDWGVGKAGFTFGADWHFAFKNIEGYTDEYKAVYIISVIPRFIIGVNCKFEL